MRSHRHTFTLALTGISRLLLLRDHLLGRIRPVREGTHGEATVARYPIASGSNLLDAVYVRPARGPARTVVLVCHGIGETVEHWQPMQELLAASGAASLVFDYSGYGRSTGRIDAAQCERDAAAAFAFLRQLAQGAPIGVLGFSLGVGIAAAVAGRLPVSRLVLCAGYTSFRAAAHSLGIPRGLGPFIPPLWHVEEALRDCSLPVLVVHGERDRLFPVRMAAELAACCGARSIIVPRLGHAEPYHRPRIEYWGPIVAWLEGGPGSNGPADFSPAVDG